MPRIPEELIDEIQARIEIAEFIGSYVPLKRAGRHYKGLCPFHKEKTPSFHVNTDKQIFHCFGCGVGGNVISFLMHYERLTFPEAARILAEQAKVNLPKESSVQPDSDRSALNRVLESACQYFERVLQQEKIGSKARAYLTSRGVRQEVQKLFRLGAAPSDWDTLLRAAQASGTKIEQLDKAGLVLRGKSGYYDRFRERLIFPISDLRGQIVGFGGRSLAGQEPKYLNSPETRVYQKGKHLYGLYQARDAVLKQGKAILVEGYFDCVAVASAGLKHVVSPLGTALTVDQIRLLRRYTQQVVLAFDSDAAGQQATLRGIDSLLEAGFDVFVAQLQGAKDPDEYLQQQGVAALERVLEEADGVFEALLAAARRQYPQESLEHRAKVAQFMLLRVAKIPDAILRSEYCKQLAERLGFEERSVLQDLARYLSDESKSAKPEEIGRRVSGSFWGAEALLIGLLLEQPDLFDASRDLQLVISIEDEQLKTIGTELARVIESSGDRTVTAARVVSRLQNPQAASQIAQLVDLAQTVANKEDAIEDCRARIHKKSEQRQLGRLREEIKQAQRMGKEDTLEALLSEYQRRVKGG